MVTDPISDLIIRLKNAGIAHKESISLPCSKLIEAIANVLVAENYIKSAVKKKTAPVLDIVLNFMRKRHQNTPIIIKITAAIGTNLNIAKSINLSISLKKSQRRHRQHGSPQTINPSVGQHDSAHTPLEQVPSLTFVSSSCPLGVFTSLHVDAFATNNGIKIEEIITPIIITNNIFFISFVCPRKDSNPQPHGPKPRALSS